MINVYVFLILMLKRLKCHPFFWPYFELILINTSNSFNMDLVNKEWDQADQQLNCWLAGDKNGGSISLVEILKSTYLTFRQLQIERLNHFCLKAFEYYQEKEKQKEQIRLNEFIEVNIVLENEVPIEVGNELMFRISEKSPLYSEKNKRRNNARIIGGIIDGDQEVYNELYEFEFPKVVRLISRYSGNQEIAQDVFQDAIIILIEKVYTKKLDLTSSVKTYLYSICKFLWMDQLRKNTREKQMIKLFDQEYTTEDISISFYDTPDIFENVCSEIKRLGDPGSNRKVGGVKK